MNRPRTKKPLGTPRSANSNRRSLNCHDPRSPSKNSSANFCCASVLFGSTIRYGRFLFPRPSSMSPYHHSRPVASSNSRRPISPAESWRKYSSRRGSSLFGFCIIIYLSCLTGRRSDPTGPDQEIPPSGITSPKRMCSDEIFSSYVL